MSVHSPTVGAGEPLPHVAAPDPCDSPGTGAADPSELGCCPGASPELTGPPAASPFQGVLCLRFPLCPAGVSRCFLPPQPPRAALRTLPCAWVADPRTPRFGDAHPAMLDLWSVTGKNTHFLAKANFPSLWLVPSIWLELRSLAVSPWRCPWALRVPRAGGCQQDRAGGAGAAPQGTEDADPAGSILWEAHSSCREQGKKHRPGRISLAGSNPAPGPHQLWLWVRTDSLIEF